MSVTLSNVRDRVRVAIEESTSRFWQDSDLNSWINDGLRDVARRCESVKRFNTSISTVAGTAKYTLPTNIVRVHRVEFVPSGQTQVYSLEASNYDVMDSIWGVNQSSPGIPRYYVMWGFPPSLQIQFFPVPNTA